MTLFPETFGEADNDYLTLLQRDLILQIDEALFPENETLPDKRATIDREIKDRLKPIDLLTELGRVRESYIDWKNALILEGFPVTNQTSCVEFWQFVKGYRDKYKKSSTNGTTD